MITTIVIIGGALYNAFEGNAFGIRDFAESIGIITGAHGAAVLMKKDSEPESPEPQEKPNGDSNGR